MSTAIRQQHAQSDTPERMYPISADVEYRLINGTRVVNIGTGRTRTISSSRILLEADKPLLLGLMIEMAVVWPVRLDQRIRLKLQIFGRIMRSEGDCTWIDILRHEFRTVANSRAGIGSGAEDADATRRTKTAAAF